MHPINNLHWSLYGASQSLYAEAKHGSTFYCRNKYRLTRSDKLAEAEREYEMLKAEGEETSRRFDTIVRLMNEEIIRFQEQKTLDMGLAFHEFAKGQARLANGIADGWRSLLPKLEACSS